jgi:hypothetical protein
VRLVETPAGRTNNLVVRLLAFALRTAAQRLRAALAIAFRPAALSVLFAFCGGVPVALAAAHLFRCAAAIRLRVAALNFFSGPVFSEMSVRVEFTPLERFPSN